MVIVASVEVVEEEEADEAHLAVEQGQEEPWNLQATS